MTGPRSAAYARGAIFDLRAVCYSEFRLAAFTIAGQMTRDKRKKLQTHPSRLRALSPSRKNGT